VTYREQDYVDRCYCDAPATAHCTMCNRARCTAHVEKNGHCHRCDEAIGYEMDGRRGARIGWSTGAAAGGFLGSLIAHSVAAIIPVALGAAAITYGGMYVYARRRARRVLGPKLAASVGEVAPVQSREPEVGNHPNYKAPWLR
jgi:hypothetical protein